MDIDFIRILLKWKNKRVSIIEKLSKVNNEKIIIFKNRKQLNEWYKKQFNTNIEIWIRDVRFYNLMSFLLQKNKYGGIENGKWI